MSVEDVNQLLVSHGADRLRVVDPPAFPTHAASKGRSFVEFTFNENGLETVRRGEHRGLTRADFGSRLNLCTGAETGYLTLTVKAPREFAGARVWIDDTEQHLGLSSGDTPTATYGLETGRHTLLVKKEGLGDVVLPLSYELGTTRAELRLPR
jgi:hypothetical protein